MAVVDGRTIDAVSQNRPYFPSSIYVVGNQQANTGTNAIVSSSNVTLTNPIYSLTTVKLTGSAFKVTLPAMNRSNSIGKGLPFTIQIPDDGLRTQIYPFSGSIIREIFPGEQITFILTDNTTNAGTFSWSLSPNNSQQGVSVVHGLGATGGGGTTMTINFREAQMVGGFFDQFTAFSNQNNNSYPNFVVDISVAGPVALGRDQAAAFSTNQLVHLWAISSTDGVTSNSCIATQQSNWTAPVLPVGYTHACYLFSALIDGSGNFETINIGPGSIPVNTTGVNAGNRGWTSTPSAGQILVGQGANLDPAFVSMSGGITVNSSGVSTLYIPQNSKSANYTTVLTDAGKQIYHPTSDNNARTFTIDSNANVAYPIGTWIEFLNASGATNVNNLSIAITTDTLRLVGAANTTGTRTLAVGGLARALKTNTTEWHISGIGLT